MPSSHDPRRNSPLTAPPTWTLLRRLFAAIRGEQPRPGLGALSLQCLRALRVVFFRKELADFLMLRRRQTSRDDAALEFLACLRFRHYLSRRLSLRQRVAGLLHHTRHEQRRFVDAYRAAVHRGDGLELWRQAVDGVPFCIRLVKAQDNAFEGELSAVLFVREQRICVMSFSYVDASAFGLPSEPMLFITRNQTDAGSAAKMLFVRAFKQNLPAYFCLMAISGIALAHGMTRIAAVTSRAHVAFEAAHRHSFDRSYGAFWATFQARPLDGQAVVLPVPLALSPLADVSPRHRSRARARRAHWQTVRRSAWSAMHSCLRLDSTHTRHVMGRPATMSFG